MRPGNSDALSDALLQFRAAGLHILSGGLSDWVVRLPDGRPIQLQVKASRRAPSPSAIKAFHTPPGVRPLFVVESSSTALTEEALRGTVDLVELNEDLVIIEGRVLRGDRDVQPQPPRSRPAWVRWAIMRTLCLLDHPAGQEELAQHAGTAQATVSQTLRLIPGVERVRGGWAANDKNAIFKNWLEEYPGTQGVNTYWYGLEAPMKQATELVRLAGELEAKYLLTGDAAADIIAPWRLPRAAKVYVSEVLDLTVLKLTLAPREQSTMTVTVPADPTVWHTASVERRYPGCADPLIAYWDLKHDGGSDANEAADVLLATIRRTWNA